jgi:hypothetical protein
MSHNQKLQELLDWIEPQVAAARKESDFQPVFDRLKQFEQQTGPIKFDHTLKWLVGGIGAAVALLIGLALYAMDGQPPLIGWIGLFVGLAAVIGSLVWVGVNSGRISSISDQIFDKDICFDNHLEYQAIDGLRTDIYEAYRREFGDFRGRGDEQRYVSRQVQGHWIGPDRVMQYEYYQFHYVEVYYVPVTRTVGKTTITTMERRTRTCYRYGIIVDFPYAEEGVALIGSGGRYPYADSFKVTAPEFNDHYRVVCDSTIAAARLLKPAVVLALIDLAHHFSGLSLEFTRTGRLNISFNDSDVLSLDREHSISEPAAFEQEIMSQLDLPKLRRLMAVVQHLKRHNDDNFELTAAAKAVAAEKGTES